MRPSDNEPHERGIGHLLLVAGPSGAGKSTLVRQIQLGERVPALSEHISNEVVQSLDYRTSSVTQYLPAILNIARKRGIRGFIVDYDFSGQGVIGGGKLPGERLLPLFNVADKVTVITLLLSDRRLAEQLRQRERNYRVLRRKRSLPRRLAASLVARVLSAAEKLVGPAASIRFQMFLMRVVPNFFLWCRNGVKKLKADTKPSDWQRMSARVERKLAYYEGEGNLDALYRAWFSYIEAVKASGTDVEHIMLEQKGEPSGGAYSWHLLSSSDANAINGQPSPVIAEVSN